jgi:hypothetical protein
MIFNELYSAYYNAVANIISAVIDGETDEKVLNQIVCDNAFGESMLTVLPSLKSEKWQLVHADMTTPLQHKPTMPLTLTQKQWLKAISLDPRIKLFGIEFDGLYDVEPLFTSEDYCIYDKYMDGDPYEDEAYIQRFRTILSALNEKRPLKIQMVNRKGNIVSMTVMPQHLEYSEKDDKFRLISTGCRYGGIVNLARITTCEKCNATGYATHHVSMESKESLTLRIFDERNALERTLLHFAHFEKRVERIDTKRYLVHIKYNKSDETEMVIRILSFGPMVEVIEPQDFKNLIIARLKSQKSCELK